MSIAECNEFVQLRYRTGLSLEELASALEYSTRTLYRYERGEIQPRRVLLDKLQALVDARRDQPIQHRFRFIDLFAGIGGIRRGFDRLGGECVFTSEWDKYAQQTYQANYVNSEKHKMAGDITQIPADEIPEHDVLLAGFPCQPFSLAGISKKNSLGREHGFRCEAQGTLFFDVARIIEYHRPAAFLLENVKNLVNHDGGRTFHIIHETLTKELGYTIQWKVIDGKRFVPQHRERIYIVGFREPNGFDFEDLQLPDPFQGPTLGSILHPEDGTEQAEEPYTFGPLAKVADKYTLSDHLWQYLQDYAAKHKQKGNGFGFGLFGPNDIARTLSARYHKDGSEILIRQDGRNPRRLTPRECARLMGFDQSGQPPFKIPVSDTQAYRQFGNSVVVPVIEAIAQHMAPWIVNSLSIPKYVQSQLV